MILVSWPELGAIGTGTGCPVVDPSKPPPCVPVPAMLVFPGILELPLDRWREERRKTAWDRHWWYSPWMAETAPAAQKAIEAARAMSKTHWDYHFGPGKEYANLTMQQVLERYPGKLVATYGSLKAPTFSPGEKASVYAQRGGYLLFVDPGSGAFSGKRAVASRPKIRLYSKKTAQIEERDFRQGALGAGDFDLFMVYDPAKKKVQLQLRHNIDWDDKTLDTVLGGLEYAMKGGKALCAFTTSDKVSQAAAYAAYYPPSSPYVLGWQQFASQCGLMWPRCPPPPPGAPPPPPCGQPLPSTIGPVGLPIRPVQVSVVSSGTPTVPPLKWFERPTGKAGIALGVTAIAGTALWLLVGR